MTSVHWRQYRTGTFATQSVLHYNSLCMAKRQTPTTLRTLLNRSLAAIDLRREEFNADVIYRLTRRAWTGEGDVISGDSDPELRGKIAWEYRQQLHPDKRNGWFTYFPAKKAAQ